MSLVTSANTPAAKAGLSATIPLTATEAMFARWVRRPHHPVG
jgi:hypothetical protein